MTIPEDKQPYADSIRQLIPINELPDEPQNELIRVARILEFSKKDYLFRQGDRDDYSYYLLEGEIDLEANNQIHNSIAGGTERARYPMAQLQPRQFSGRAKKDSVVLKVARDALDRLLVLNQGREDKADEFGDGSTTVELDVLDLEDEDSTDWMTRMLQSEIFSAMPTANIHKLFALLEPIEYKPGDIVIQQGEPGEHYYIIQEGRCEVLRQAKADGKAIKLAELRPGDSFGEEALITQTTRNATVRMLTDGIVGRLSKDDFISLVQEPVLRTVSAEEAEDLVAAGGKWLDIRFKEEHDSNTIEDCEHIPLNILRMQADKLDRTTHYVLFCDTGGRSSIAAFLLMDRGFQVSVLKGGLVNHPSLASPDDVTQIPATPESASGQANMQTDGNQNPSAAPEPETPMDPEIMATVLDAELTRTNMQLERAKTRDQTEQKNAEMAKKLEQERARIETEKKRIEAEVKKLKQEEEARLKKMQEQSERKLQKEREKLEAVYSRNAEEMEKLEKMRLEAETRLKQENERIEKEAEEARKNKQDADVIRQELEAARRAMDQEAEQRRKEQEAMKRKIEMQARRKIEIERKKLAEQIARNNQEIEKARREKAAAEAARLAARQEAELMIQEYKSQHEKTRAEEEERIKAERLKLEAEQQKIQETLAEIQKAKAEAEKLRRMALAEVTALKTKQVQSDAAKKKDAGDELKNRIKHAQEKLARASENVTKVEQDEEKIAVVRKVNEEDLARKKVEEEALRKQLEEDLDVFRGELEEQEKQYESATTQLEHMKRIKERAEAAKKAAEEAASDLLSDVAAQLGKDDR